MDKDWYVINNLPQFVDTVRAFVFNSFNTGTDDDDKDPLDEAFAEIKPEEREEFDEVLSHEESMIIVKHLLKRQFNKKTKKERYAMSDDIFLTIVESLNDRMISNILNKLVNKGMLETAFDSESNDFVFWVKKDEQNKNEETPETD